MYYSQYLNLASIKTLVEVVGRCGHEIRNFSAGYARIEFPEIQIIDNLSGQIEGIMREICSYLENNWEIKPLIRNAVRPTICLSKMIDEGLSEALMRNVPAENLKKVKQFMVYQANCLQEIDDLVNKAILDDSKNNFGKFKFDIVEPKVIIPEIMKEFVWDLELKKFTSQQPTSFQEFSDNNKFVSKFMCNYAHEIQNLCSAYNHKAPENTFTNKIINLAGQIEDSSRRIQDLINNHNPKTAPNKHDYAANLYSTVIGVCDAVHDKIKEIEDLSIEEKCPLKITNDEVHRLLSAEENFANTVKQNMLMGYVF